MGWSMILNGVDVDEFNSAITKARVASNAASRAEWYERTVSLYQGEYLQNLYYEWVFPERRRLTQSYLGALQELASFHLANQPKQAVEYIEKAIPLDKLNEDLYTLAMRAYSSLNDRSGLTRTYSDLERILHDELGAEPMPETTQLYNGLIGK